MTITLLDDEKKTCPTCLTELYIWERPDYYELNGTQAYYYKRLYKCAPCKYSEPDETSRVYTDQGANELIKGQKKLNLTY